jgi:hypothetical protein
LQRSRPCERPPTDSTDYVATDHHDHGAYGFHRCAALFVFATDLAAAGFALIRRLQGTWPRWPTKVSNVAQTAPAKQGMQGIGMSGTGGLPMSKTDQFWQYAKEALLTASDAENDDDKQGLLDLARTWTQAALQERASAVHHDSPAEVSAA